MAYPLLQFVDSPSSTAAVRYDFHAKDASAYCHPLGAGDLDLGVPSFVGEPEGVGADYGYRQMRFTQRIEGTKAVALAKQSALAKELFRSYNWLKFQWNPSVSPVYFKTYRTETGALSVEHGDTANAWDIVVPLVADPFAYGARVTLSDIEFEQTIPTDLTGGRSAMTATLPTLKGDAPTALRVSVKPAGGVTGTFPGDWLVGCVAGSSSMVNPAFNIGASDGLTADVGTGASVSNAAYLAGDYRQISVAANDGGTGSSIARRLFGSLTATLRGRYKIQVRCEADTPSGIKNYAFRFSHGSGYTTGTVIWPVGLTGGPATSAQGWVDLGDYTFPPSLDVPTDGIGTTPTTFYFELYAGTTDNSTGTIRVDAIKLIPVDGPDVTQATLMKTTFSRVSIDALRQALWDGVSETAWAVETTGVLMSGSGPELAGSFPVADPAAAVNLLVVMATRLNGISASSTTYATSRKSLSTVSVSYFPRFLHIGDGT